MISAPIMTATLLIITRICTTLKRLYIRKSILVESCEDWLENICIQHHLNYQEIQRNTETMECMIHEISKSEFSSYFLDDYSFEHINLNSM